ncbi:hypothetical protein MNBD_ACTINO01-2150 [hydrothermal vent metagenome]|uniref:Uncharacterized protein n=1 Tax=hydrothermal vent metagenome TaxID=652676 RepID=A0A3B0SS71_9ZZZZ
MEDLINEIQSKTGLSTEKVIEVVTIVADFLKEQLPQDLVEQIASYLGEAAEIATGAAGKATEVTGSATKTASSAAAAATSAAAGAVGMAVDAASSVISKAVGAANGTTDSTEAS